MKRGAQKSLWGIIFAALVGVVLAPLLVLLWQCNQDLSAGLKGFSDAIIKDGKSVHLTEFPDLLVKMADATMPGDTLYYQAVRILIREHPRHERIIWWHLRSVLYTKLLSFRISREECLKLYLGQSYMGKANHTLIYGMNSASEQYFSKPARNLTGAEMALLMAKEWSPDFVDFQAYPERAVQRAKFILSETLNAGGLDQAQKDRIEGDLIRITAKALPKANL